MKSMGQKYLPSSGKELKIFIIFPNVSPVKASSVE